MFPSSTTCPKPTTSTRRTTPATERSPSNSSSGSNRSSIASSNSSGYCSAGVLLQHPFHQFHHQPPPLATTTSSVHPSAVRRQLNQSNASGTSPSPSAQRLALQSLKSPDVSLNGGCVNEETDENAAQEHGTADLYQQGRKEAELLYKWLESINQTDCFHLFLQSGYDMHTVSRMTPEDLTAIGITFPSVRKRLAIEISRLQIPDGIPNFWPSSVQEWLQYIHLQCYYDTLMKENYTNLEKVMEITWEDLEDIGIKQLGHQKKIILAIDKLKKIHASKIISSSYSSTTTPFPNNLFQLENSMQSFRKNSPLACHELIVEQIDAKNRNKEKKLPITLRSPEIVHLKSIEIPAPEIVAIQVNNRSWPVVQQQSSQQQLDDEASNSKQLSKYESFHGCSSKDFTTLLNDSSLVSPIQSSTNNIFYVSKELSNSICSYEPPLSPAPQFQPFPTSPTIKMRPQVAPKPNCSRVRRASGGPVIGINVNANTPTSPSFVSTLKRQNSCQSQLIASQSTPNQIENINIIYAHNPSDQKLLAHNSIDNLSTICSEYCSQKSHPPAPPKRTNSIKSDLNYLSKTNCVKSTNEVDKCNNNSPCKMVAHNQGFYNESPEAKLPPLAKGLSRTKPLIDELENRFPSMPLTATVVSPSPDSPLHSPPPQTIQLSYYSDNNTLPFANDNVGTIKQRQNKSSENENFGANTNGSPAKPLVKPKPKVPAKPKQNVSSAKSSHNATQPAVTPQSDQLNCQSVFDDIDNLFQGLTKELNDLLTG